ncbi:HypC/HybG/HupF family hydrogenase formation chaperone [Mucispirillum schaedleri]|jgi:hydrogenase expression/formation protein HypC|uniref:Hydrogenase maturation factor HypC n=1 Tax=Mucispirillum schaedleri ASF457 TaxID=1379858 RepID=V2QHQ4_9BACT|nr:HypC/HybG/HupF family hydrogenase formation chaperone [Mucispirillum schaedleri]MCX4361568.1 HypC/HybG/HupF family hydrogenase formation chaperone [Mucispirillum schaedleri]USF23526.1 Hydrogenase maturation factor HypC [Mucispirillum schaedleri ASF457]SIW05484.1 protein required for maturation of hydrogenases 1 and 3 [Mucispirillum schaedleri ASF457]
MCLGFPGLIEKLDVHVATVDVAGTKREISTIFLGDDVKAGDWVVVHAGFAISKIDEKEAKETLEFLLDYTDESKHSF